MQDGASASFTTLAGEGAYDMTTDTGNKVRLTTGAYNGLPLGLIEAIDYSSYVESSWTPGIAPFVYVDLCLYGVTASGCVAATSGEPDARLIWEPRNDSSAGNVVVRQWQDWSAPSGWWSSNSLGQITSTTSLTLATVASEYSAAVITGIGVGAGTGTDPSWGKFHGAVGNLTVTIAGNTGISYDFEQSGGSVVPSAVNVEAADLSGGSLWGWGAQVKTGASASFTAVGGEGAYEMTTGTGNKVRLATGAYVGLPLGVIQSLSYRSYVESSWATDQGNGDIAPFVFINVCLFGVSATGAAGCATDTSQPTAASETRLIWEPRNGSQTQKVALGQWQDWTAPGDEQGWFSNNELASGAGDSISTISEKYPTAVVTAIGIGAGDGADAWGAFTGAISRLTVALADGTSTTYRLGAAENPAGGNGSTGSGGGSTGTGTASTPPAGTTEVKAGGSASSSKAATPSASTPVIASVTSPVAGAVSFTESTTVAPQKGFSMLGRAFVIEAPKATAAKPLSLDFALDLGSIPSGASLADVTVFRDGVAVPQCAKKNATTADPDPCVATATSAKGVGSITVLSSHASTWTFGTTASVATARIAGSSRYATAADIAAKFAKTSAFSGDAVILANGTDAKQGVDALAANFLAGAKGAPILLTGAAALDPQAKSSLTSLFAGRTGKVTIYVMGGLDSVSQAARDAAVAAVKATAKGATVTVVSVSGANRSATSAVAAAQAGGAAVKSYDLGKGAGKTAFLASGLVNADALAAGAASAKAGVPVLLTNGGATLPTEVSAAIKTLGITNVVILGGTDRVAKSIESGLTAAGVHVLRLAGSGSQGRFDTAVLVNRLAFKATASGGFGLSVGSAATAYLANGVDGFADALAVGPLAGATSSPLLTVAAGTLPSSTKAFLSATSGITQVVVLGQSDRITSAVVTAAQNSLR